MKKLKIILGVLILYGAGTEYISASHELLTYWNPGILTACLIMLFISSWLIGSGMAKEEFNVRSLKMLKSLGLSTLLLIVFACIGLITYKPEPEMVVVNGMEVNIAGMMEGSQRLVPDKQQRKAYCMCVVEGLTKNKEAYNYKNELKEGKIDYVFKEMYAEGDIDLSACGAYLVNLK